MAYRVRDLLEHWRSQGAITAVQFDAGQHFLRLYDATIAGRATIDPERIRVDGGSGSGPAAERMVIARGELNAIKTAVGQFDFALLCRVIGMGRDLKADTPEEAERKYISRRVRDALHVIANRDRLSAPAA